MTDLTGLKGLLLPLLKMAALIDAILICRRCLGPCVGDQTTYFTCVVNTKHSPLYTGLCAPRNFRDFRFFML